MTLQIKTPLTQKRQVWGKEAILAQCLQRWFIDSGKKGRVDLLKGNAARQVGTMSVEKGGVKSNVKEGEDLTCNQHSRVEKVQLESACISQALCD